VNYENVTLCKLALAGTMYDSLTPFNYSLGRLNKATGGSIDLTNPAHRISLMKWLNDWGCRHLSEDQHEVASHSILNWYQGDGASLFTNRKPLWDLGDHELEIAAHAYGSLKDKTGARRVRGGSKQEVHIGPTAASKILFAIRPKALMPWDEAMRTMLELPLKDDGLVFSDLEGKPLLPNTVTHAWIKLVRRIGLKGIRLHDARHSHASLMLKAGIHPKIVQERLGHSSVTITLDTYSHVAPGLQEAAAESFDKLLNGRRENVAIENHY